MDNYKIFAYEISGKAIGTEKLMWNQSDLLGNAAFTASTATTISGYSDITSIENFNELGTNMLNGQHEVHNAIWLELLKVDWSGLTTSEKSIVIERYSFHDSGTGTTNYDTMKSFLVSQSGMTSSAATEYLGTKQYQYFRTTLTGVQERFNNSVEILHEYLSSTDVEDFLTSVNSLAMNFLNYAFLGQDYLGASDGIMDFINSTNGYSGNGLEERGYSLLKGTYSDLKSKLQNSFVDSYFWNDISTHIS